MKDISGGSGSDRLSRLHLRELLVRLWVLGHEPAVYFRVCDDLRVSVLRLLYIFNRWQFGYITNVQIDNAEIIGTGISGFV